MSCVARKPNSMHHFRATFMALAAKSGFKGALIIASGQTEEATRQIRRLPTAQVWQYLLQQPVWAQNNAKISLTGA